MPVIAVNVTEGPDVQADGQYRGALEFVFSDGREFIRRVRAADAAGWASLATDMIDPVLTSVRKQDAEDGINPNEDITANKEANIKDRAVAYLRAAWKTEQAYDAYLLLDKFNMYRLAQGWNLNQVHSGLLSAGLLQEEWDEIRTAYQYLSAGQRPSSMSEAKTIQNNWESR